MENTIMNWQAPLGAFAALLLALPASAFPILSEVYYDAVGSDDGQVFVELYGAPGTPLDGLVVEGINGADGSVTVSLGLTGVLGVDGVFVIADSESGGGTSVSGADLVLNFDFQNGPDSVVLRSPDGVLDALGYGSFDAGDVFAGEGMPAADPAPGQSLARVFADLDSQDNASDFASGDPSPGSVTLFGVPEPSGAVLLGLAALGWWSRRRRH
jgi:hypothetical protein